MTGGYYDFGGYLGLQFRTVFNDMHTGYTEHIELISDVSRTWWRQDCECSKKKGWTFIQVNQKSGFLFFLMVNRNWGKSHTNPEFMELLASFTFAMENG